MITPRPSKLSKSPETLCFNPKSSFLGLFGGSIGKWNWGVSQIGQKMSDTTVFRHSPDAHGPNGAEGDMARWTYVNMLQNCAP